MYQTLLHGNVQLCHTWVCTAMPSLYVCCELCVYVDHVLCYRVWMGLFRGMIGGWRRGTQSSSTQRRNWLPGKSALLLRSDTDYKYIYTLYSVHVFWYTCKCIYMYMYISLSSKLYVGLTCYVPMGGATCVMWMDSVLLRIQRSITMIVLRYSCKSAPHDHMCTNTFTWTCIYCTCTWFMNHNSHGYEQSYYINISHGPACRC